MDAVKKVDALTDAIRTVGHARDINALVNSPVYAKLDVYGVTPSAISLIVNKRRWK